MKVESIAADDRDMAERNVIGNAVISQSLFARPFVDAACARATPPQLRGAVARFGIVRPLDRDLTVGFFDYLCGFDRDGYIPS